MTPGQTSGDMNRAAGPQGAADASRTRLLRRPWVRTTLIAGASALSLVATLFVAYELAVARVPQHRAALERLVRVHTGLDVRFNELGLRWGWYGPEAVFRRVELGEPGRSNVLLRAPQLVVGFDAWRTMQTGQLAAGRITLVAPDIDFERVMGRPAAVPAASGSAVTANRARILERWRGGRIDLQGGTLRLPGPAGAASPLLLHVRRASLHRSGDEWNGFGLVFLPERLGRTARLAIQLQGDLNDPATLSGALRFEGRRLAFAGWREMLDGAPRLARNLPVAGGGDVTLHLTLKSGRIEKADGEVHASDVTIADPPWLRASEPAGAAYSALKLEYLSGQWRFVRRAGGGQLQIEQLALSRADKEAPIPRISIEIGAQHIHGGLARAPLDSAVAVAQWLAPELVPAHIALEGFAEDVDFDWNAARPAGARLAASAHVNDASFASSSGGFVLSKLRTVLSGTESRVAIEVDAPAAVLELQSMPDQPIEDLKVVTALELRRAGNGWTLSTPRLALDHESGDLVLSGALNGDAWSAAPVLEARGTVARADVAKLRKLFAGAVMQAFGPAAMRLDGGRIEDASFELQGPIDTLFSEPEVSRNAALTGATRVSQNAALSGGTRLFKGALTLRDGRLAAEGPWPEAEALEAKLEWSGSRIRAAVVDGRAGAFNLDSFEAQWNADGASPAHVAGHARVRIEQALAWVRDHREMQEYVPHLQDLVAHGDALVDFDVSIPATTVLAPRATPPRVRTHIATVLEGVQFSLAPELPPVEALRGSLAFDAGHLQRSTLSATWLGGPLTLKLSERRGRRGNAMAVQAQGFVDARKLAALSQLKDLARVSGETPWSGEFVYTAATDSGAARWQARADSNLVGITSELPAPFGKVSDASVPLHLEIMGSADKSDVRANLAERVKAAFALSLRNDADWSIERGAVQLGGGTASLPADDVITVQGHVKHLDLPAYILAWQQLRAAVNTTPAAVDITADELALAGRVHPNASIRSNEAVASGLRSLGASASGHASGGTELVIEAHSLGVLTGTLEPGTEAVVLDNLRLVKEALTGAGSIRCAATPLPLRPPISTTGPLACHGTFELSTDDVAATLADMGFRPDLSASSGSLSGELQWQPHAERSWLETATGQVSMRLDDGVTRNPGDEAGRPFPLLTVPALLTGLAAPAAAEAVPAGELEFKRLDADFQLREGQALTSNLHFDGDAEILVRGRTGLLAHDYDQEAWVLRGEDRIPASLRRLAATPRVAAAWMTLRDLIRADTADRSRIVLHLRGSWSEPVVTVE